MLIIFVVMYSFKVWTSDILKVGGIICCNSFFIPIINIFHLYQPCLTLIKFIEWILVLLYCIILKLVHLFVPLLQRLGQKKVACFFPSNIKELMLITPPSGRRRRLCAIASCWLTSSRAGHSQSEPEALTQGCNGIVLFLEIGGEQNPI